MLYIHSICVKGWLFESSKDQSKGFVLVCSQHVFLFNTSSAFKVKAYLRTLYPTTAIGVQTRQLTFPFKDFSFWAQMQWFRCPLSENICEHGDMVKLQNPRRNRKLVKSCDIMWNHWSDLHVRRPQHDQKWNKLENIPVNHEKLVE